MTPATIIASALDPDLFSDDPQVAHMAASPASVQYARKKVMERAAAAERALKAAGYAVVPVEPTEAMMEASYRAMAGILFAGPAEIYRAMLAALEE